MSWVVVLFGAMTAIGSLGGLAALFYVRGTSRKLNAEAHKYGVDADVALSGQALEWMKEWRDESAAAKKESRECSERVDALMEHISRLEQTMRANGLSPGPFVWPRPVAHDDRA